jgi:hypothetical protein
VRPGRWLALIPGAIVLAAVSGMAIRNVAVFREVAGTITQGGTQENAARAEPGRCVETYGLESSYSENYVREGAPGAFQPAKGAPREFSTVVRGMARNNCAERLNHVQVRLDVSDDKGGRGSAWAQVGPLAPGAGKAFERAWIGRLTSYRVAEIR